MKKKTILFFIMCFTFINLFSLTEPEIPDNLDEADSGTISNPIHIANLGNLLWLSENENYWGDENTSYYFAQTNNIDAAETTEWNNGCGFDFIGYVDVSDLDNVIKKIFYGNYDGNNFTIDSLCIKPENTNHGAGGLFGYIMNSELKNIHLTNITIEYNNYNGTLAGVARESVIYNCSATGIVSGEKSSGLIGNLSNSTMNLCYSTVTIVMSSDFSGGLCGGMYGSQISNCYYYGIFREVFGGGGLSSVIMLNSTIENCYSVFLDSNNSNGGICYVFDTSEMDNCLWNSGISESEDMIVNYISGTISECDSHNSVEMKLQETYEEKGWDFTNIWDIDPNINDGYPFLKTVVANDGNIDSEIINYSRCYPNPFNPETTIEFSCEKSGNVTLVIYNLKGQEIKTLVNKELNIGQHSFIWNGKDSQGKPVASGIYFYRINTEKRTIINKMILLK